MALVLLSTTSGDTSVVPPPSVHRAAGEHMTFRLWFEAVVPDVLLLLQSTILTNGVFICDATEGSYARVLWCRAHHPFID